MLLLKLEHYSCYQKLSLPHGVDVTPDGKYIIIGGKLDTHVTIFDFAKIKEQIDKKSLLQRSIWYSNLRF